MNYLKISEDRQIFPNRPFFLKCTPINHPNVQPGIHWLEINNNTAIKDYYELTDFTYHKEQDLALIFKYAGEYYRFEFISSNKSLPERVKIMLKT